MDEWSPNASDGNPDGHLAYFKCKANHAYFAKFDELFLDDEEIQDIIQSVTENPNVGDTVILFDGKQGTVRYTQNRIFLRLI